MQQYFLHWFLEEWLWQKKAKIGVIVVDIQGDFTKLKNGSLAVEGTDEAYIKAVEENTKKLKEAGFSDFCNSGLASQKSRLFLYQS